MTSSFSNLIAITTILAVAFADKFDEEQYGVKYADHCEICKIVSNEITLLLSESEGKHEVLETGYSVQKEKKKTKVCNNGMFLGNFVVNKLGTFKY